MQDWKKESELRRELRKRNGEGTDWFLLSVAVFTALFVTTMFKFWLDMQ